MRQVITSNLKIAILLFSTVLSMGVSAAVPLKWTVECSRIVPASLDAYHGTTLDLEAHLLSYGEPLAVTNEAVGVYWQTNGMGAVYWSMPASSSNNVLRAVFTPAMDPGTPVVHGFIGSPGDIYSASFILRFRQSPGATPNAIPLPTPTLDFSTVEVLNPPWIMPDYSTTNETLVATIEAVAPAPGDYATVSNKAMTALQSYTESDPTVSSWAKAERKPGYTWDEITGKPHVPSVSMGDQSDGAVQIEIEGNSVTIPAWAQSSTQPLPTGYDDVAARAMRALVEETDPTISSWAKAPSKPTYSWNEISNKPTIPTVPTAQIDANTATNEMQDTAIASLSGDNVSTRAIVMTWEQFLGGSNVVFSITNYISGAYSLDAAKFRVLELHNGAYNETYNSRDEIILHINHFKTNDFAIATNQVIGAVNEAISTKADKAWGRHTSSGGVAPSNTVYMTAPNTVFAGGLEYERVAVGQGAVCVLTTRGAPTWTQGDEGTFKFQDDGGTNFFGFAKTDSYTIGANTDGIDVANNIVTLTYDITMSGVPCVWYKSELSPNTSWEQLNLPDGSAISGASVVVTWDEDPPAGQEICYINCGNSPRGFFKATIEVAGDSKFMTNMRADLSGGIVCTNTAAHVNGIVKPTFNGSTVNWTWSAQ